MSSVLNLLEAVNCSFVPFSTLEHIFVQFQPQFGFCLKPPPNAADKKTQTGVNFCCFSKPAFNQLPLKHLNIYVMSVDCLVKVSVQPDSVVNSLKKS